MNKPITEEQKEVIRKMYPKHFASEIAPIINTSRSVVTRYAQKMGISHDAEWYAKARAEQVRMVVNRKGARKRLSEHMKALYAKERRRMINGEKQKTKYKIRIIPRRYVERMDYMVRIYKYFRNENPNSYVLYYDSQTKRSARAEKTSFEEYGIIFKQGSE